MKLVYIFMTSVLVLFFGKFATASEVNPNEKVSDQVKKALWAEGIVIKKNSKTVSVSSTDKKKSYPEELSKAIVLEKIKLYGNM